jgi:hypothetical protein
MEGESGRPAWRPSKDDAMRDLVDEKLAAALHDVPVPEGLGQRLLERLDKGELALPDMKPRPAGSHRIAARGRGFILAGGLTAAAAMLVAVWLGAHRGEALSPQFMLDEAIRSFDVVIDQQGALLGEKPAPADYPFSQSVLQLRGTRWRSLEAFVGRSGVVYDLPGPAGAGAALYVIEADTTEEFDELPAVYPFTTAGCCASAWREGGLVYVLVVQGDPATYRAYLNLPRGPMA